MSHRSTTFVAVSPSPAGHRELCKVTLGTLRSKGSEGPKIDVRKEGLFELVQQLTIQTGSCVNNSSLKTEVAIRILPAALAV